jgi:hypothetical protein
LPSRDVRLELDPQASIVPDQYTGTTNGTGIDLQGAEAALISIPTGAFGGTTPTASYKVQESDTLGSGYTDVADTDLIGATGNTSGVALAASAVQKVSYIGSKRFVRVIVSAVGGSSPVIRTGATVIQGASAAGWR